MKMLHFPILRQTFDYDCGATVIQAVLVYYGIELRKDKIIKHANTTKEAGTRIPNILDIFEDFDLKTDSGKMTIDDLKKYTDQGVPVILAIQAWSKYDKKNPKIDWNKAWENGHYAVLIGYDRERFYFSDPTSFVPTYLTYEELKERWHDVDDIDGTKYINHGIAVYGKEPEFDLQQFKHMD